jgi:ABC-type lipoprotein export system ATPase subunit
MIKENRGSQWKRWDLHTHTKGTAKNDQFTSQTFEEYCKTLFISAIENNIAVIGITDYFNIDNYLKVKDYKENIDSITELTQEQRNEIKNIYLIPNVELRVLPVTDRGKLVNLHCLFNPDYVDKLEDDFFSSIEMSIGDDVYKMNKSGFIRLGKSKNPELNDAKAYELGLNNFVVTNESLRNLFKKKPILRENTVTIVSNSNNDGASAFQKHYDMFEGNDQSSLDEIRKSIYYLSDLIFSGNPKDREYFLGIKKNQSGKIIDDEKSIILKCGSLKACVHGCDAHIETKLFKPDENRYCWVKSSPTFEGLKQVIYEPEQRVKIQPNEPDFKEDKLIIDEVQYFSSNNSFTPEKIKFNKNLNVIIGGKSSGKSILLYNIAATLETNGEVTSITNNKYDFRKDDEDFNFEVKSLSGVSQKMFDKKENSIIPNIKYIPQNYLTKLAEPKANKKGEELLKYVRGLLLEDDTYKNYYQDFLNKVKSNDKKRNDLIDNYFETKDNIKTKGKELKEKGSEEVLTKSVASNIEKISELKRSIGLTPEEIANYNTEKIKLEKIESEQIKIQNDYRKVSIFNRDILNSLKELKSKKDLTEKSLENTLITNLFTQKFNFLDIAINDLDLFTESIRTEENVLVNDNLFKTLLLKNRAEKVRLEKVLEPLIKNDKVKQQITEIDKIVAVDKQKLQAITQLKTEIKNSNEELTKNKDKLFELYIENSNEYPKIISTLNERTKLLKEQNLEIIGTEKFNVGKFIKTLYDISDGRSYPEKEYLILQGKNDLIDFRNTEELVELKKMFKAIVEDETFVLNTKTSIKNAVKILLDDYFVDYWETEYDGDKMGEMSTGKASFVILMLIVGLSSSKAPILIDQPEDNLDNRSITKDLVKYLRDKKTDRQIILVTHNPNIVVNADAENVIVANQKGQNDKETSSIYKFDYTNGAIETTKEFDEDEKDLLKSMGIREHIADIVEGGKEAFKKREVKYGF